MKSLNYQHNHLLPTFKPQALMFLSLGVLVERFSQSYEILSVQLQLTIQGFNLSFIYFCAVKDTFQVYLINVFATYTVILATWQCCITLNDHLIFHVVQILAII